MSGPFVLAAGGTGGHLFPAQALASELMRRGRRVVVMTDGRGHNYRSAFPGAEIATVPAATFAGRSPLGRVVAFGVIALGVVSALAKLRIAAPARRRRFRRLSELAGDDRGVASRACPALLHEQNAVLGRVNRLLAPRVAKIAASLPVCPLRAEESRAHRLHRQSGAPGSGRAEHADYTPPGPDGPIRLLVFGGSQGARSLSELVPAALGALARTVAVASEDHAAMPCAEMWKWSRSAYRASGIEAEVGKFFTDLPRRMARAHLVIARSGASTLSELTVIGRPAILVPYPHAMDDHQTRERGRAGEGGRRLGRRRSAISTCRSSRACWNDILTEPDDLARAARAAANALGRADAAQRLADLAEQLAP